jgi:hypothetical protein
LDTERKVYHGTSCHGGDVRFGILLGIGVRVRAEEPQKEEKMDPKAEEVYIPKDLDDCFVQLKKTLSKEQVEEMKEGLEDDMINYHFGLGMSLRNTWGLWGGSRLARWFNEKGIHHPDDMSGVILDSFWRQLNGKPIDLDKQIKHYRDFWKTSKEVQDVVEKEAEEKKRGK